MKLNTLLQEVINKVADQQSKQELFDGLRSLHDIDIPDHYERLVPELARLIPESDAPRKKDIADKVISSYRQDLDRSQYSQLVNMGLEESDIKEVMALNLEERTSKVADIIKSKLQKQFSMTESERNMEINSRLKAEKERADRYQQSLLEREKDFNDRLSRYSIDTELKAVILSHEFTDILPDERIRYRTAVQAVEDKINAVGGRLLLSNGQLKLVDADDETKDIWDSSNRVMTVQGLVEKTLSELNLIKRKDNRNNQRNLKSNPITSFPVNKNLPYQNTGRQEEPRIVSNQGNENRAFATFKKHAENLLRKN